MSTTAEESDAALVANAIAGDAGAFRVIVTRHQRMVYACALSFTKSGADAADVTQDVFIRFHRGMTLFDTRRELKPYLLAIAANLSRNLYNTNRMKLDFLDNTSSVFQETPDEGAKCPASQCVEEDKYANVRQYVDRLPSSLKQICSLYYLSENSCAEVAKILKMTEGAVKVALHRARRKLLEMGISEWKQGGAGS